MEERTAKSPALFVGRICKTIMVEEKLKLEAHSNWGPESRRQGIDEKKQKMLSLIVRLTIERISRIPVRVKSRGRKTPKPSL